MSLPRVDVPKDRVPSQATEVLLGRSFSAALCCTAQLSKLRLVIEPACKVAVWRR